MNVVLSNSHMKYNGRILKSRCMTEIFSQYSLNILSIFSQYSLNILSIFSQYSIIKSFMRPMPHERNINERGNSGKSSRIR